MKKALKMVAVGAILLVTTGCGYTQHDADEVKRITAQSPNNIEIVDEHNAHLDANKDGIISPADYVTITLQLKGEEGDFDE